MKPKPIIFSGPMVRALLEGRKTQTRRILKSEVPPMPAVDEIVHEPKHAKPYLDAYCGERKTPANPRGMGPLWAWWTRDDRPGALFKVGYVPGDVLWVREAWRTEARYDEQRPREVPYGVLISREADYDREPNDGCRGRYRHARFMPRWASRLTLEVTDLRVQRLQDISEEDALAEGIFQFHSLPGVYGYDKKGTPGPHARDTARDTFAALWKTINGEGSWAANAWVAALTFTTHKHNVDELLKQREVA